MIIPYEKFLSLAPVMHQVCYSDVVDDRWILLWGKRKGLFKLQDWRSQASSQLRSLSNLCQLANQTIRDAVNRFLLQSFAVSNVLTKADFDVQSNKTLNQFFSVDDYVFSYTCRYDTSLYPSRSALYGMGSA